MATYNITSDCTNCMETPQNVTSLDKATAFLEEYYIWIIFVFGFPGNLISLVVIVLMCRKSPKTSFVNVALLAVVDNIAIILKILDVQHHKNRIIMDEMRCQCLYFFGVLFSVYANWILMVISFERFLVVMFEMKVRFKELWSLKKSAIVIVGVFLLLCLIYLHFFFTLTANKSQCHPKEPFEIFFKKYWLNISVSIYAFIPSVCITVLNAIIIRKLLKTSKKRRGFTSNNLIIIHRQERQLTKLLVIVAIVFILLTLPRSIFIIYNIVTQQWEQHRFIHVTTSFMADYNHAVKFYLYFIAGPRFRDFFLRLFPCYLRKQAFFNCSAETTYQHQHI